MLRACRNGRSFCEQAATHTGAGYQHLHSPTNTRRNRLCEGQAHASTHTKAQLQAFEGCTHTHIHQTRHLAPCLANTPGFKLCPLETPTHPFMDATTFIESALKITLSPAAPTESNHTPCNPVELWQPSQRRLRFARGAEAHACLCWTLSVLTGGTVNNCKTWGRWQSGPEGGVKEGKKSGMLA